MLELPKKSPTEASFSQRMFRLKIKANAFVEVWNTLAESPVDRLPHNIVPSILREYGIDPTSAGEEMRAMYAEILRHCIKEGKISEGEHQQLGTLRSLFELTNLDIAAIENKILVPEHGNALAAAASDGHLSEEERHSLAALAKSLRLSESVVAEVTREALTPLLERVHSGIVADRRLTPAERLSSLRSRRTSGSSSSMTKQLSACALPAAVAYRTRRATRSHPRDHLAAR